MDNFEWGRATWTELAALGLGGMAGREASQARNAREQAAAQPVVALLPVGAVEAHGPHLAVLADVTIATAAATAAVDGLEAMGYRALVLPPISYSPAGFADGFPGTISIRPSTLRELVEDIAVGLERQGVHALVVVNAHLDPGNLEALHAVAASRPADPAVEAMPVLFPDISRKPWALRLTDEFKSGACHGGQYETSVVMAAEPEGVRSDLVGTLPSNPASLSDAIRRGATSFEEAGVDMAYCGAPAQATAAEGQATIRTLGGIVTDAVRQALRVTHDE
ncbi:MAG: creatininase family protein [Gemmatimonadetes bacterium]|nr:creatininase family protein [Gemmatimonadota bacterium]